MNTKGQTDRFERKFFVPTSSISSVDTLIKLHPALFRPLYYERRVNNIYFDTILLEHYSDHVAGVASRSKVRIRWYGETFGMVQHPVLEIKMKQGEVGMKKSFPLLPFNCKSSLHQYILPELLERSSISEYWKERLQELRPVLLNSYLRRYWISFDHSVRLTVDRDWLSYYLATSPNPELLSCVIHEGSILEMKYSVKDQKKASHIASRWPWRLTRNSKYVIALEEFILR